MKYMPEELPITLIDVQSISHDGISLPAVPDWHPKLKDMPPIRVRKASGNGYILVDGARRLSVALKMKWQKIPAIVEPEPVPVQVSQKTKLPPIPSRGGIWK